MVIIPYFKRFLGIIPMKSKIKQTIIFLRPGSDHPNPDPDPTKFWPYKINLLLFSFDIEVNTIDTSILFYSFGQ